MTVSWDIPMWNESSVPAFILNVWKHLPQPSILVYWLVKSG